MTYVICIMRLLPLSRRLILYCNFAQTDGYKRAYKDTYLWHVRHFVISFYGSTVLWLPRVNLSWKKFLLLRSSSRNQSIKFISSHIAVGLGMVPHFGKKGIKSRDEITEHQRFSSSFGSEVTFACTPRLHPSGGSPSEAHGPFAAAWRPSPPFSPPSASRSPSRPPAPQNAQLDRRTLIEAGSWGPSSPFGEPLVGAAAPEEPPPWKVPVTGDRNWLSPVCLKSGGSVSLCVGDLRKLEFADFLQEANIADYFMLLYKKDFQKVFPKRKQKSVFVVGKQWGRKPESGSRKFAAYMMIQNEKKVWSVYRVILQIVYFL